MSGIGADRRFITERRDRDITLRLALGDLHRPASIGILLCGLRQQIRSNLISRPPSLDRVLLAPGTPLPGSTNQDRPEEFDNLQKLLQRIALCRKLIKTILDTPKS